MFDLTYYDISHNFSTYFYSFTVHKLRIITIVSIFSRKIRFTIDLLNSIQSKQQMNLKQVSQTLRCKVLGILFTILMYLNPDQHKFYREFNHLIDRYLNLIQMLIIDSGIINCFCFFLNR